jgi:hypothetical protein
MSLSAALDTVSLKKISSGEETEREEERSGEVVRDTTFVGSKKERIYISGFEGSQAVPARPNRSPTFLDVTRTAYKTKNLEAEHRHTDVPLPSNVKGDTQRTRRSRRPK